MTGASVRELHRVDEGKTLERVVLKCLAEVNILTGETMTDAALALTVRAVVDRCRNWSVNGLVLALRTGIGRKVYGKLTFAEINQWIDDYEADAEEDSFNEHQRTKG